MSIAHAANDHEAIGERALRVAQRLSITPIRNSNVIEIAFRSGDQSQAAQVVNRVIEEYLAYHAIVHGQKDLSSFYEKQSRMLLQNVHRSEEALRDFSYREGLVAPDAEIQAAVTSISQIEGTLRTNNSSVAAFEERVRAIREQLTDQPTVMKRSQHVEINPVVKQLREHLVDRQVDRVALLRKYTENDRHVRDNADEIAELNSRLQKARRDEPTVVTDETFAANPVYEAQLGKLLDLEAKLRATRASKLSLDEDLARSRRRLVMLKQKAIEFNRLDQEVKRHQGTLELFEKRAQEARIGDAMNQDKLVNVQVVQRPGLPLPRTDDRRAPLLLAIISGLAVSLGGAFGLEYVNRTLRFERDVERHLGLPVLGTVKDATQG